MPYESPTYPGQKNNNPNASASLPTRDLSIINQPAGFIEFNNTEGFETMSFVHKTGAMLQMNNHYTGLFAPRGYKSHIQGDNFQQVNGQTTFQSDRGMDFIQMGDSFEKSGNVADWQQHSENYLNSISPIHEKKRLFELRRVKFRNDADQSPDQKKEGELAPCPSEEYESKHIYTAIPTILVPVEFFPCPPPGSPARTVFAFEPPEIIYEAKKSGGGRIYGGWYCLTCWGSGESPSSQDGKWEKEKVKDDIEKEYADLTDKLVDIESNFGKAGQTDGGHKVVKTGQSKIEVIGTTFNSLRAIRVDPVGKLVPYGVKVDPFGSGVYMQYRESPLVENVHVDPGIGGDYVLNVCDRFAVNVGANGIHFKTNGQFNIFGSIVNILGEDITITGKHEIELGAERIDIEGEIITLRPKANSRQIEDSSGNYRNLPANGKNETERERHVLVDGNLNVAQNTIIKGGAHIEGELSIQHITAPMEYQITETDFEVVGGVEPCVEPVKQGTLGDILPDIIIGKVVGTDVVSVCANNAISVHPHYHYFKNIPLRLFRDATMFEVTIGNTTEEKELLPNDAVRAIGARNNFDKPVLAKPVKHSSSNETVLEKFGGNLCGEPLVIKDGAWEEELKDDKLPSGEGVASENYKAPKRKAKRKKIDEKLIGYYDANKKELEKTYQNTEDFRNIPQGLA